MERACEKGLERACEGLQRHFAWLGPESVWHQAQVVQVVQAPFGLYEGMVPIATHLARASVHQWGQRSHAQLRRAG